MKLSPLTFVLIFPYLLFSQIEFSEIMFDPLGSEATDEFVELYNRSDQDTVFLSGWRFGDDSGSDPIVDAGRGFHFLPHQYAVILDPDYFMRSTVYDSLIPKEALVLTVGGSTLGSAGLSNSRSETIMLLDNRGETVARVTYSIGNKPGHSDEKIDLFGPDEASNWADSKVLMGTPGFENSVSQVKTSGMTELDVQPDPFSPDQDGLEDKLTVSFSLPWPDGDVSLRIYDLNGRLIRNLIPGMKCSEKGFAVWDGNDNSGQKTPMGIYIVALEGLNGVTGESIFIKRTVVLASPL
jgi:hypothetical protein